VFVINQILHLHISVTLTPRDAGRKANAIHDRDVPFMLLLRVDRRLNQCRFSTEIFGEQGWRQLI